VTRVMKISVFQPEQIQNGVGYLRLLGRLSPGVSLSQTAEELQALHVQYKREHPRAPDGTPDSLMGALPLQDSLTAGIKPTLMILTGAVAFVLLIACANVAGLMMARATGRAKEMAVRAALGAGRMQLAWQLLSESLLLSVAGAALGVLFAKWGVAWLVAADAGNNLPGYQPIELDLVVLAFAAASSVATGVAFGLVPALQASRPDLNGVLRDGGWGSTGAVRRHRLRSTLVAAQIGVSVILLIGAGLLIESFRQVQNVKLGFNPERTLVGHVSLPPAKYPEGPRRAAFVREVAERLERSPGVKSVALSLTVPMLNLLRTPILAEGQDFVPLGQRPLVEWNIVAPRFFRTHGVPMMSGRDFTWTDDAQAPRVVIVNQALARRFWAGENPLGKHVIFTRSQASYEVVGVVGDTRSGNLEGLPPMAMYSSYAQGTWPRLSIAVRAAGDPMAMSRLLSAQIAALDRDLPVANIQTMEQVVANTLAQRKQTMYLIAGFAGLALVWQRSGSTA
jgi:putative ABC transport system permease protein